MYLFKRVHEGLMRDTKSAEAVDKPSDDGIVVRFAAGYLSPSETSLSWVIDSRTISHICHQKSFFVELGQTASLTVDVRNDSDTRATMEKLSCTNIIALVSVQRTRLDDDIYVPGLKNNFLSVVRMTRSKCQT